MKKISALLLLLAAGYVGLWSPNDVVAPTVSESGQTATQDQIELAFKTQAQDLQLTLEGKVKKLLPDDRKGSRHQRFIIRVDSGRTLLVAHNIDLAPRVKSIKVGDRLQIHGVYEWNEKGGVVHWTHHDPRGRHEGGWIRHNGQIYQ
ncbi:MAG: DUF3465 domain-containing protein [Candidatus Thiodiazotropha sp. L084R]